MIEAVYIPEDCYKLTIVRHNGVNGVKLFFKFDLPNNCSSETTIPLVRPEQLEIVYKQLRGWKVIAQSNSIMVYERNETG